MTARLIKIGNSRGVRLPKAAIERAGLGDRIEIAVRGNEIVLRPATQSPRAGWDKALAKAFANGATAELTEEDKAWLSFPNKFDEEEWTW